jgi:hypothetical protein
MESLTALLCVCVQELYERLVEAERLRAEAEKQRGDDLSKIAMMLASGKAKDAGEVIPQSPPTAADKSPSNVTTSKSPSKQEEQLGTQSREGGRIKAKHAGGL